jgi:GWxTD domain-containing protein
MIRTQKSGIAGLTLVISVCAAGAFAQTGYRSSHEMGEAPFMIDVADFKGDKEDYRTVEVYYKLFYTGLSFQKVDSGYVANYEIGIEVTGDRDKPLDSDLRQADIFVRTYQETRRKSDFVINMFSFELPEEDGKVRVSITDLVTKNSLSLERDIEDRDYWGKYPTVSSVEFAQDVRKADANSAPRYVKNGLQIIPMVSDYFGGAPEDSLLIYYHEVYPGEIKEKYAKVVTEIYHRVYGIVYADTTKYGELREPRYELRTIHIDSLPPGDYELEVKLMGRRDRQYDNVKKEFEIALTAESVFSTDYETAVKMLKYIATSTEMDSLEHAKEPSERRRLWDKFWANQDKTPEDGINETKREYFRRIRHANRYFSYLNKEGWKTTRGMIYITYGEPDDVEDAPFELSTKPYQIWTYWRLSPPRRFLFIDEYGDGNYILQPPYDGQF